LTFLLGCLFWLPTFLHCRPPLVLFLFGFFFFLGTDPPKHIRGGVPPLGHFTPFFRRQPLHRSPFQATVSFFFPLVVRRESPPFIFFDLIGATEKTFSQNRSPPNSITLPLLMIPLDGSYSFLSFCSPFLHCQVPNSYIFLFFFM